MKVLTRVRWLKPEEGGRSTPPPGQQYSTVAKFDKQTEEAWRKNAWSLVLNPLGAPDKAWTQMAWARFLTNEATAPTDWLCPGSRFALFEGLKKVAEGVVLERADLK